MKQIRTATCLGFSMLLAACGNGGTAGSTHPNSYYGVYGSVSGLSGKGLAIELNGGTPITVSSNGQFTVPTTLADGTPYSVTVTSQPTSPSQTCSLSNGTGVVSGGNVNFTIECTVDTFTVGGSVSGLQGTTLELTNGNDTITVNSNGPFTFPTKTQSGGSYGVKVTSQPTSNPTQFCTFGNGSASGTVTAANITTVSVICANVGRFFYASYSASNAIYAYRIDPGSGALAAISGSPYAAGSRPSATAAAPSGKFLYVANYGDQTLSVYLIDQTSGELSPIVGSPFAAGAAINDLAFTPSGAFLYAEAPNGASSGTNIFGFAVDPNTGVPTSIPGEPLATDAGGHPAFDPGGKFMYTANSGVAVYGIDQSTGALTVVSPNTPIPFFYGYSAALRADGKFLYDTGGDNSPVAVFSIATSGNVAQISGSPFTDLVHVATSIVVHPSGSFAYIADCNCRIGDFPGSFDGYLLDPDTGAPTAMGGNPVPAGTLPNPLIFDQSGKFAYEANSYSLDISAYAVDANTGQLTPVAGSPYPLGPSPTGATGTSDAIAN